MNKRANDRKTRKRGQKSKAAGQGAVLAFDNNDFVKQMLGVHDRHLAEIEDRLDITAHPKGNQITLTGARAACQNGVEVLESLYRRLEQGLSVGPGEVDGAIRLAMAATPNGGSGGAHSISIHTKRRVISPRTPGQTRYIEALGSHELVLATGPAGTGKTYLAVAAAAQALANGQVDRIILSRPAVEAGEQLGFLPGDMRDKVDPYLRPLYDALYDLMPGNQVIRGLEDGTIEIAPLAFMRGRTLSHAFVILDEAQNCTSVQMKMFLTRLGEQSRMVVTGDPSQIDLPRGTPSGLNEAIGILDKIDGITHITFDEKDVVRHALVSRIVHAYDERARQNKTKKDD
jgi:phosphate starvation-inducible PhoH-like protein